MVAGDRCRSTTAFRIAPLGKESEVFRYKRIPRFKWGRHGTEVVGSPGSILSLPDNYSLGIILRKIFNDGSALLGERKVQKA